MPAENTFLTPKDSYFEFDYSKYPKHCPATLSRIKLDGIGYVVKDTISRKNPDLIPYFRHIYKVAQAGDIKYVVVDHFPKPEVDYNLDEGFKGDIKRFRSLQKIYGQIIKKPSKLGSFSCGCPRRKKRSLDSFKRRSSAGF
jgi:hypothetical protein